MKAIVFFMVSLLAVKAGAQTIKGTVRDKMTRFPLSGATVRLGRAIVATDTEGRFSISGSLPDTLRVSFIGCTPQAISLRNVPRNDLEILLQKGPTTLDAVQLTAGKFGCREDSLRYREQFSKEFAYQPPGLKSFFNEADGKSGRKSGSTGRGASILSLNVGAVISWLNRKKSKEYKLHERVFADEELRFLNANFSRGWVGSLIPLKEDSLSLFMQRYRPPAARVRSWTRAELMLYVRASYFEFIKPLSVEKKEKRR